MKVLGIPIFFAVVNCLCSLYASDVLSQDKKGLLADTKSLDSNFGSDDDDENSGARAVDHRALINAREGFINDIRKHLHQMGIDNDSQTLAQKEKDRAKAVRKKSLASMGISKVPMNSPTSHQKDSYDDDSFLLWRTATEESVKQQPEKKSPLIIKTPSSKPLASLSFLSMTGLIEKFTAGEIQTVDDLNYAGFEWENDSDGNAPLHIACQLGNVELAKLLIKAGARLNQVNTKGWAPLHYAAMHDNVQLCELLLDQNVDIDICTLKSGDTALHIASALGNASVCTYLLSKRAHTTILNHYGQTPLDRSFEFNDATIAKIVTGGSLSTVIRGAIKANRPGLLAKLLNESTNLKKDLYYEDGTTALHLACCVDNPEFTLDQGLIAGSKEVPLCAVSLTSGSLQRRMIELLIEKGKIPPDVRDSFGRTPLHVAVEWGQEVACVTLLEKKASLVKSAQRIRARDESVTPIMLAVLYDHASLMKLFLDCMLAENGVEGLKWVLPSLIKRAVEVTSFEVLRLMLSYKKNHKISSFSQPYYPLHLAALVGNVFSATLLLNDGAEVREVLTQSSYLKSIWPDCSDSHLTPLHCAAYSGAHEVCELLLRKKADCDIPSQKNKTPLVYACEKRHESIIDLLLNKKAYITTEALEYASLERCRKLIERVRKRYQKVPVDERGARENELSLAGLLSKKDSSGKTLFLRAAEKGDAEKVALLLEYFADPTSTDSFGRTALHLICNLEEFPLKLYQQNYLETLEQVLKTDGVTSEFINKIDTSGNTALHYAIKGRAGAWVAIESLLKAGANAEIPFKGKGGITPRSFAETEQIPELTEVFKRFPAPIKN